jgi:hypothetical protein
MKPVNVAAQLAAAETELARLEMVLAQVKEDREELRQERDDWRREAEMLCAAKLAKLRQVDERRFAPGASPVVAAAHGLSDEGIGLRASCPCQDQRAIRVACRTIKPAGSKTAKSVSHASISNRSPNL